MFNYVASNAVPTLLGLFFVGSIAASGASAVDSAMGVLFWVGIVPMIGILLLPFVIKTKGQVSAD